MERCNALPKRRSQASVDAGATLAGWLVWRQEGSRLWIGTNDQVIAVGAFTLCLLPLDAHCAAIHAIGKAF